MMEEWHVLSLDIWGNADDGWELNQAYKVHELFIADNLNIDEVLPMLRRCHMLANSQVNSDYGVNWDSEGLIEVHRVSDLRPLLQIQKAYKGHSYEK